MPAFSSAILAAGTGAMPMKAFLALANAYEITWILMAGSALNNLPLSLVVTTAVTGWVHRFSWFPGVPRGHEGLLQTAKVHLSCRRFSRSARVAS